MEGKFNFQPRIFTALKGYSKATFLADFKSGMIVVIVALPLAIAFAIASGVSPEKGLITAIIGGIIVSFLGGTSLQISGPTGAFIVTVYGIVQKFGFEGLAIATVMSGVMLFIMGLCRLGTVIKFIPYPIVVGFTSGIALSIFTSQMKDFFGLTMAAVPADFISKWIAYAGAIDTINPWSVAFAVSSIILVAYTPRITTKLPGSLIAILVLTGVAYVLRNYIGITSIDTIADHFVINGSLPSFTGFDISMEKINQLITPAFSMALLGAIVSLLSATVADGVTGEKHNSNMELIALGTANMVVPFFGGIPVTGAIARTLTNIKNGGKTPISGIVQSLGLLLLLLFLGPFTKHIPMACLAGVLVVVSYNMSDWRTFVSLVKNQKSAGAVLVSTFLLTVIFDLSIAIEVGLLLSMLIFMRRISETTKVSVTTNEIDLSKEHGAFHDDEKIIIPKGVEVYEIDGPFFFGVASKFGECMKNIGEISTVRIIRMRKVPFIDSTGLHNLETFFRMSEAKGIHIIFSGVNAAVHESIAKSKFYNMVKEENICNNINDAIAKAAELVEKRKKLGGK